MSSKQNKSPPEVLDRGKYGFAVRWHHVEPYAYESSMPDEKTARLCASAQELLLALKKLAYWADTITPSPELAADRKFAKDAIYKATEAA